jgi:hypothetical protein
MQRQTDKRLDPETAAQTPLALARSHEATYVRLSRSREETRYILSSAARMNAKEPVSRPSSLQEMRRPAFNGRVNAEPAISELPAEQNALVSVLGQIRLKRHGRSVVCAQPPLGTR